MATGIAEQENHPSLVGKITWTDGDHDTEMYMTVDNIHELDWVFSQDNASVEIIKLDTTDRWGEKKIMDEAIKNTLVLGKIPHGHGSYDDPFRDCLTQHVRPKLNFRGRRNK